MNAKEKKVWTKIIDLYKNSPNLWNKQNPDYMNKNMRQKSFRLLLDTYRQLDDEASIGVMKNKLINMRTSFLREYKKVQNGTQNRSDSEDEDEDPHVPSLWYYDLMLFLTESGAPKRKSTEALDESSKESKHKPPTKTMRVPIENEIIYKKMLRNEPVDKKCYKNDTAEKKFLQIAEQVANKRDGVEDIDEFDSFGRMMALELRKLKHPHQPIAQKLMYDILFYAKMGRLNEETKIKISPSPFSVEDQFLTDSPEEYDTD